MARIRVEQVIDHFGPKMRLAIADTLKTMVPQSTIDAQEFFKNFKANMRQRCRQWEDVPNNYVETD